ncbi:ion channel [Psychromarinibacter sp. S121]|uniref:ion channel n=1 Tax=Psychromarinibacter sp. S121 TaxID=3415127 RepID=UPI003C7D7603
MLLEILYGTALILVTTLLGLAAMPFFDRLAERATADEAVRHGPGWLILQVCFSVVWLLTLILLSCWFWSLLLVHLDLFETVDEAMYFSLVAFTTVGFGDVVLPEEWAILSGMLAINGLFMAALLTGAFVDLVRKVRSVQALMLKRRHERQAAESARPAPKDRPDD